MRTTNQGKHIAFRGLMLLLVICMVVSFVSCNGTTDMPSDTETEATMEISTEESTQPSIETEAAETTGNDTSTEADSQTQADTVKPEETEAVTNAPSDSSPETTEKPSESVTTAPGEDITTEPPEEMVIIREDYVIIYEGENENARKAAEFIQNEIFKGCGILLGVYRDSSREPKEKEILIGTTSREQTISLDGLDCGWAVGTEGNYCLINAATRPSFDAAVSYFVSCLEMGDGAANFRVSDSKQEAVSDPFASADLSLRVATFNIKNGIGVGHDMAKLAELITPLDLDIVGLQEVDVGTERANGLDTLKLLAEAAGYEYYRFTPSINYQGGQYGTAIMSRYPIVEYETVKLATPAQYEKRAYGHAVIDVNGCYIHFYNTHLSFEDTTVRKGQFKQLNEAINGERGFILTADFNTGPVERKLIESAKRVNTGQYATFPSSGGKIDDILVHEGWNIVTSGMVAVGSKSDHNLLWAELHFEG